MSPQLEEDHAAVEWVNGHHYVLLLAVGTAHVDFHTAEAGHDPSGVPGFPQVEFCLGVQPVAHSGLGYAQSHATCAWADGQSAPSSVTAGWNGRMLEKSKPGQTVNRHTVLG